MAQSPKYKQSGSPDFPHYPWIIAEVGINHNGDLVTAGRLVDMALRCGVDAIKFQKRTVDKCYSKEFLDQPRKSPWGTTQRDQKMGLELDQDAYDRLQTYSRDRGFCWFASAWDLESLDFLAFYDPPYHKIASAMITDLKFVEAVAQCKKTTFISCGMAEWEHIDEVVGIFEHLETPYYLLHSVSVYPCPPEWCNIEMVKSIEARYGFTRDEGIRNPFYKGAGYSGHETGIVPSVVAAVYGAKVIERHITLDRAMYGSDQAASMEEQGLKKLVDYCRMIEAIKGDGVRGPIPSEMRTAEKLRTWRPSENNS